MQANQTLKADRTFTTPGGSLPMRERKLLTEAAMAENQLAKAYTGSLVGDLAHTSMTARDVVFVEIGGLGLQ